MYKKGFMFILGSILIAHMSMIHAAQSPVQDSPRQHNYQQVVNALGCIARGLTERQICDRFDNNIYLGEAPGGTWVVVDRQIYYKKGDGFTGYWSLHKD